MRGTERPRGLADHVGGSRERFVRGAVPREAQEVLLDQVVFPLPSPAFAAFQALLANPPAPTAGLRRLLLTKAPWE